MRHALNPLLIVAIALLAGGCKEDRESLAKQYIATMNDFGTAIKSVQDESSSKAAAPKIQSVTRKMQDLKKMDAMPKPAADEDKKLTDKYKPQMEQAVKTVMEESFRIAMNPALMTPELKAAMEEMKDIK